jgi:DNA-binding phage protein
LRQLATPQGINQTKKVSMALTRDFKETVAARVQSDSAFARALLGEAITLFINGEPESAKLILRDLVNATVGFEALAEEIHKPAKSLHRMLSQSGNPTMSNILSVFAAIKRALKVEVHAQVITV